ncbi:MAG: UDP-N-acetylmuramate dehydrogenase [Granulosicoccaceae bacterium]
MFIESGYSLKEFNSFGFDVTARFFSAAGSEFDVIEALEWAEQNGQPVYPLGGGSNTIMVDAPPGLVLHINILGIEHFPQEDGSVLLRIGGGEDWPRLVAHTVEQGWYGLENLALIPGNAGAAPVQNIGAYGVEISDVLEKLEAVDRETGEVVEIGAEACDFAYRDSAFKGKLRGRYIITYLWFRLSLKDSPVVEYPALLKELRDPEHCSAREVFDAVVSIRSRRLPVPEELGNAGSFFTNPIVSPQLAQTLTEQFADLPQWPTDEGEVKLAAAWLVEQCGWKGFRDGDVGVYPHQAIVLVNYGGATGQQIMQLAQEIIASVDKKFGVVLEIEPNVIRND